MRQNKLARVVREQESILSEPWDSIKDAQAMLDYTKDVIRDAATPERVNDIIDQSAKMALAGFDKVINSTEFLTRSGIVIPSQGYVGIVRHDAVAGVAMTDGNQEDPIKEACEGDYAYMMWVKALRLALRRKEPAALNELSDIEFLARLGLTMGSSVEDNGDLFGATGFMLTQAKLGELGEVALYKKQLTIEPIVFSGSGLADHLVLSSGETAFELEKILNAGGELN